MFSLESIKQVNLLVYKSGSQPVLSPQVCMSLQIPLATKISTPAIITNSGMVCSKPPCEQHFSKPKIIQRKTNI